MTLDDSEQMERWRQHFLSDKLKGAATTDEAFAAGWRAAMIVQAQGILEDQQITCGLCGHTWIAPLAGLQLKDPDEKQLDKKGG